MPFLPFGKTHKFTKVPKQNRSANTDANTDSSFRIEEEAVGFTKLNLKNPVLTSPLTTEDLIKGLIKQDLDFSVNDWDVLTGIIIKCLRVSENIRTIRKLLDQRILKIFENLKCEKHVQQLINIVKILIPLHIFGFKPFLDCCLKLTSRQWKKETTSPPIDRIMETFLLKIDIRVYRDALRLILDLKRLMKDEDFYRLNRVYYCLKFVENYGFGIRTLEDKLHVSDFVRFSWKEKQDAKLVFDDDVEFLELFSFRLKRLMNLNNIAQTIDTQTVAMKNLIEDPGEADRHYTALSMVKEYIEYPWSLFKAERIKNSAVDDKSTKSRSSKNQIDPTINKVENVEGRRRVSVTDDQKGAASEAKARRRSIMKKETSSGPSEDLVVDKGKKNASSESTDSKSTGSNKSDSMAKSSSIEAKNAKTNRNKANLAGREKIETKDSAEKTAVSSTSPQSVSNDSDIKIDKSKQLKSNPPENSTRKRQNSGRVIRDRRLSHESVKLKDLVDKSTTPEAASRAQPSGIDAKPKFDKEIIDPASGSSKTANPEDPKDLGNLSVQNSEIDESNRLISKSKSAENVSLAAQCEPDPDIETLNGKSASKEDSSRIFYATKSTNDISIDIIDEEDHQDISTIEDVKYSIGNQDKENGTSKNYSNNVDNMKSSRYEISKASSNRIIYPSKEPETDIHNENNDPKLDGLNEVLADFISE